MSIVYIYIYTYVYIHIYIYIEREREIEREIHTYMCYRCPDPIWKPVNIDFFPAWTRTKQYCGRLISIFMSVSLSILCACVYIYIYIYTHVYVYTRTLGKVVPRPLESPSFADGSRYTRRSPSPKELLGTGVMGT